MNIARQAFTETLLRIAHEDKRLIALATDSRGSVTLCDFARELPLQFVECGIAEQDAVGIAAGLACTGFHPFVCGPACFFSMRSAEQVKIDVAYAHTNVKIIGVSGGVSYGALGSTHHSVQDIAVMRAIPGLQVIIPADARQTVAMTYALSRSGEPAYVRMGRGAIADVYSENAPFTIGKANLLREGGDAAIIACGEMVRPALDAAELLVNRGVRARVIDMHTIKPLDVGAVLDAAATGAVVTVEEHSVYGGLGSAVAEVVCQHNPTRMRIMGLPDEKLYSGTSKNMFEHYGLTALGIASCIEEILR